VKLSIVRASLCFLFGIPHLPIVCWLIKATEQPVSSRTFTGFFCVPTWSSMSIIGLVFQGFFAGRSSSETPFFRFEAPHMLTLTPPGAVAGFLKNPSRILPRVERCPLSLPLRLFAVWPGSVLRVPPIFSFFLRVLWRPSKVPWVGRFPFLYSRRSIRTSYVRFCRLANSRPYFSRIPLVLWLGHR